MKRTFARWCLSLVVCCLSVCLPHTSRAQNSPQTVELGKPHPNTHAHNDYEHLHPLYDALRNGFCSVEADIYLMDAQLLVAHEREEVKPGRTLQALYLDPLRELAKRNGGRIYKEGTPFTLLIDVKTDAEPTYTALREILRQYADIFTEFRREGKRVVRVSRAVTAVLFGNRPLAMLQEETVRYAGYDGRIHDLFGNLPSEMMPLVSDDWGDVFLWNGEGEMPLAERMKLRAIIKKAHAKGCRFRFWGSPDKLAVWQVLREEGADLINADDLEGLNRFLRQSAK